MVSQLSDLFNRAGYLQIAEVKDRIKALQREQKAEVV